ncbi:uncharacterized protein LOC125837800 [Solanum verrucosum]|uniref:uncharacterized protein LOC125837800 n=1 Tax=Solanum verrucosum TaxID=315347 RepID=UPI0020D1F37F|nr:uncharacterized protein LOC125837800 [Solanum verrucosum]
MAAPLTPQEGASQTRPPLFNGKYYGWWKNCMMDHLIGKNPNLWSVVLDGPTIPMKKGDDGVTMVPKERKEWDVVDKLAIQNNAKSKKILICGIGPDEYNRISSCEDAKSIWKTLQTAHEGTTQVKKSKIDNLNRQYELFRMMEGEKIQDMHTRFTAIINEIYLLGEVIPNGKAVRKLLSVLPESWESKVEAITEARDLDKLAIDELIGNLITYELKKSQEREICSKRKEKNLVLKATTPEDFEDENIALMTKRRMTNQEADISMNKAFAAMGGMSEDESEDEEVENQSLLAIEKTDKYDFLALVAITEPGEKENSCQTHETIQALMVESDSEEEEEDMHDQDSVGEKLRHWYLGSTCSRQMTGDRNNFLSQKDFKGGNVAFGNRKTGEIQGIGKVGLNLKQAINNVYYVNGLQHNLLSISQMCNQGNKVIFTTDECKVVNSTTEELVLLGKRHKNVYKTEIMSPENSPTCLSAITENSFLWHNRLGHISFSTINKLISKELARGLPETKLNSEQIYGACAQGKQIKSSFKPKAVVSTTKPLELLHMDLCGPMCVLSK